METEWFYVKDGQQLGPVSRSELDQIVQRGEIGSDSLVWQEGMENWEPHAGLASSAPPPPPTAAAGAPPPAAGSASGTRPCTECGRTYPEKDLIPYGDQAVCPSCKQEFFAKAKQANGPGLRGQRPMGQPSPQNGLALAGLITSIVSLSGTCCYGLGFVVAIVSLILSVMGLNRAKADPMETGKGLAIAGIVISIIALLIGLGMIALFAIAIISEA